MTAQNDFTIRLIETYDEYIAVADLQREVWGHESIEIVPPSILMVNQKIGGIVAGAFSSGGALVAFVYGLPGFRHGKEVHWSHMLAVKPAWRGHGLGRRLKMFQLEYVVSKGIEVIHWTYDPLEAVNARLNLGELGAIPMEYVCDLYGAGEKSILHKGIGTDRFIVSWFTDREARSNFLSRFHCDEALHNMPAVIGSNIDFCPAERAVPGVKVEIPANIQLLKGASPKQARAWRMASRAAFQHYFDLGYAVTGFVSEPDRCYYIMTSPR